MRIKIKKGDHGPDLLKCIRDDGSICEAALSSGSAYHDLAHFVVEVQTGNQEGFWGRIAEGYHIDEYALPNEERAFQISKAGYEAEYLSTLLQTAVAIGNFDPAYAEMLENAAQAQDLPFPKIPSEDVLAEWLSICKALTKQWSDLPKGETLELGF